MSQNGKPPVLVVVQLSGGNDFVNTVVPYTNGDYYDARPNIVVKEDEVLPIDDTLGFNIHAAPLKELYDKGKVAVVQGVGYPDSSRSHFRAMYDWHTCEPDLTGGDGWVGKAVRELDPGGENVLTGVNHGKALPHAMVAGGVDVTTIADLDDYGLMTGLSEDDQRNAALQLFKDLYAPATGTGPVMDYLSQTGLGVLKGADILKKAPAMYESDVEYASNAFAQNLRDVARVHLADLGTRVFYTTHGGYDTHAAQVGTHEKLLGELSGAVMDFYQDLADHDAAEEVLVLVFTEFGRRAKDNGVGTDHGSGGGAFLIGEKVKGGLYAEYPPLAPGEWLNGEDLRHTFDFRGLYGTVLEQWMGLDPVPLVGGAYEQIEPFE